MGYPNCVVYAEAGTLTMRDCRITCGGAAPSAAHAMQVLWQVGVGVGAAAGGVGAVVVVAAHAMQVFDHTCTHAH